MRLMPSTAARYSSILGVRPGDRGQHHHRRRRQQRLALLLVAVRHDSALEEPGGGRHYRVALLSLLLVAHAEVTAGSLQVHHVLVARSAQTLFGSASLNSNPA